MAEIERVHKRSELGQYRYLNYKAMLLFAVFSGQRPQATISRLKVGHFREALKHGNKPVLDIPPECDKIYMQHYCPLHPQVIEAIKPLLNGQSDDEPIFKQLSFERWLKERKIPLIHSNAIFKISDARKFCEQMSDELQWDQSNKNNIMTYNVAGVDWRFYKSPRPEPVYDVYMKYWNEIRFKNAALL